MNIYVLSLPQDKTRRDLLKDRFPDHFSKFKFVPAIDGRSTTPQTRAPLSPKNRHRPLTGAEIACALGHIKIYESMIDEKSSPELFSLVLEDDIYGNSEHLDKIRKLALSLPRRSLVILGGIEEMYRARHLYGFYSPWHNVYRIPNCQLRNLSGTCCYLADGEMARHLLKSQNTALNRADDWATLLKGEKNVFYTQILFHPKPALANSHIETERSALYEGGLLKRWRQDGLRESIARPSTRILIKIFARALKLHRIHRK